MNFETRVWFVTRVLLVLVILLNRPLWSQGWNQWRGSNRDGVVKNFSMPDSWPDSLKLIWSVEVGAGLSSPVVTDGRIFLLTRGEGEELVSCLSADDGEVVWRQSYHSSFFANPQAASPSLFPESRGKGPFSTPLVHRGRLYTLGVDRTLSSFDAGTGELEWRHQYFKRELPDKIVYVCEPCGCKDDGKSFDNPGKCPACGMTLGPKGLETTAKSDGPNYYGAVASPVIVGNTVVTHVGNAEHGSMIALDSESGQEKWTWEGPAVSSSSPIVAEFHGSHQLVTLTRYSVIGVSVTDGVLLWSFPLQSDAQIVTPVVFEDLVVFATYKGPVRAIKVRKDADNWSAKEVWVNPDLTLWTSSPVLDGTELYGFLYSKKGQFAAIDARSGKTLWTSEGRQGSAASILSSGNVIIALKDDGELVFINKSKFAYKPLAKYSVAETPTWAHPVVWGKNILIKDESNLTLWSLE